MPQRKQTKPKKKSHQLPVNRDFLERPIAVMSHKVHDVCTVTNPFCPEAKFSKWPDNSSAATLAFPVRFRHVLTSNATGEVGVAITNSYPYCLLPGLMTGGTFLGGTGSAITPNLNYVHGVRLVSGGFSFTPTLAPMVASGYVSFLELNAADDVISEYASLVTGATVLYSAYATQALRNDEKTWMTMRASGPTAREFYPPVTDATSSYSTQDWTSCLVAVSGAPASTVVGYIDVVLNFEATLNTDEASSFLATPAPPSRPDIVVASNNTLAVGSPIITGTVAKVESSFWERAKSALYHLGDKLADKVLDRVMDTQPQPRQQQLQYYPSRQQPQPRRREHAMIVD